jgi:maltooligosyltrehalose trehalohydrolase
MIRARRSFDLGAVPVGGGAVRFRVWAPRRRRIAVRLLGPGPAREVPLAAGPGHVFAATVPAVAPGTRYLYRLDDTVLRPDPVSRSQPDGVHGPSAVVDPEAFPWTDGAWRGVPLERLVLYELHVGTFTPAGTLDAVIPHLGGLADLGVTAIELMPVAECPGGRNWGYDGVHLFAPQSTYGGPDGLRRLVDAAHAVGLGVVLDVVYNHVGPEGNYLAEYGPYLSTRHRTPWGEAVNYDGVGAAGVRRHVVANAGFWVREYHLDGLRLDAVHAIVDQSPVHVLAEIGAAVAREARRAGRPVAVIAESNRNRRELVVSRARGGLGLASQWSPDFHHALRVTLTGARGGHYEDFQGGLDDLEVAFREGFVYQGQHSGFRQEPLGTGAAGLPGAAFVVFAQTHDHVASAAGSARLTRQVGPAALRLAAAAVLLAPHLPLLFMGEEYGETAPFHFFTSFGDPGLGEAVWAGRREELARLGVAVGAPDPQDPATLAASRLDLALASTSPHAALRAWYRALLHLRARCPALAVPDRRHAAVSRAGRALLLHRWVPRGETVLAVLAFDATPSCPRLVVPAGRFALVLDSGAPDFGGEGSAAPPCLTGGVAALPLRPHQALVYRGQALPTQDGQA